MKLRPHKLLPLFECVVSSVAIVASLKVYILSGAIKKIKKYVDQNQSDMNWF